MTAALPLDAPDLFCPICGQTFCTGHGSDAPPMFQASLQLHEARTRPDADERAKMLACGRFGLAIVNLAIGEVPAW